MGDKEIGIGTDEDDDSNIRVAVDHRVELVELLHQLDREQIHWWMSIVAVAMPSTRLTLRRSKLP